MFCSYLEKMTGPEDCDDRKRHRFSILDNRMLPYGVDCEACGDAMTLSRRHIQDEWTTASSGNNTGASHSFINAFMVSMYNLRAGQGSGLTELADKSIIQRIGETEHIEVTGGKYSVSASFELIEQKYAFPMGMDLFYRFGFSIIGLPDPEGPMEACPELIPDEKPRTVSIEKPEEELTEELSAEKEEFMEEIRPLTVLNKAIPLNSICPLPEMK
ncbi:hypothetical protein BGZ72_001472, partial [Mortierella alpina]